MRHKLPPKPRPPRQSCCRGHGSGHCMRRSSCVVAAATAATARAGAAAVTATAAAVACGHGSCAIGGGSNCTRAETAAPTATTAAVACSSARQMFSRNRRVVQRLAPRDRHACCARFISPSAACTSRRTTQGFDCLAAPVAAALHLARGYIRYAVGHFRQRKQLWDCSQLHLPRRWGNSSVRWREGVEGIARLGSRAAATDAICGAAPCALVLPCPFTPETAELCSGRRLASRRVCCARIVSPSAVCTAAGDATRTRSPRCPNPASSRPCTSRAASYGMPRAIFGGGSSFGSAAGCIGRVAGVIHLSDVGAGGGEIHNRAAGQQQPVRFIALHRAQ